MQSRLQSAGFFSAAHALDGGQIEVRAHIVKPCLFEQLPHCCGLVVAMLDKQPPAIIELFRRLRNQRSEEHTSELQSRGQLVCRLRLDKKNTRQSNACIDTD